jgi:hypothetical protein
VGETDALCHEGGQTAGEGVIIYHVAGGDWDMKKVYGPMLRDLRCPPDELALLFSYYYMRKKDFREVMKLWFGDGPYPRIFADSGAYSVHTKGGTVSLVDYMKWIEKHDDLISTYAALDVIYDEDKTRRNLDEMINNGFQPLPCYHAGSSWQILQDLIDEFPYVGLGGGAWAGANKKSHIGYLAKAVRMAKGKTVFHAFGMADWMILRMLPFYSCDCSTMVAASKYGTIGLWNEKDHNMVTVSWRKKDKVRKYYYLLRENGFNPEDFLGQKYPDAGLTRQIGSLAYIQLERWENRRHPLQMPELDGRRPVKAPPPYQCVPLITSSLAG